MRVEPYLYFNGRCEEALEFYRNAIGATTRVVSRFKDNPALAAPAGSEDSILHAELKIGDSTILASDGQGTGPFEFRGFSLSITASTEAEAEKLFANLSNEGSIQVPLSATPFASRFGMLRDRYGVHWIVLSPAAVG